MDNLPRRYRVARVVVLGILIYCAVVAVANAYIHWRGWR